MSIRCAPAIAASGRSCRRRARNRAKRLLRKRSGREKRFARDVNHCLSRRLSARRKALRAGLPWKICKGIRERAKGTVRNASGECCTVGRSSNSAPSSPTRRRWLACGWSTSTRPIPARPVAPVGIVRRPIGVSIEVPLRVVWVLRPCRRERGGEYSPPGGCHTARRGGPRGLAASSRLQPRVYDTLERHVPRPSP